MLFRSGDLLGLAESLLADVTRGVYREACTRYNLPSTEKRRKRQSLDRLENIFMPKLQTLEVPVIGMDCAECTQHVQQAIAALPGVESVDVFLSSEKALIRLDPAQVATRW